MQKFINNWTATLQAPAAIDSLELSVEPAQAAKLIGLGGGDYYVISATTPAVLGETTPWEIMKITGVAAGVLTVEREQEGTQPVAWPAGTTITACLSAAPLRALQASNADLVLALAALTARVEALEGGGTSVQEIPLAITVGDGSDGAAGWLGWSSWDEYGSCNPSSFEIAGLGQAVVAELALSPWNGKWYVNLHLDVAGVTAQEILNVQLEGAGELVGADAFFSSSANEAYWRWTIPSNPWVSGQTHDVVLKFTV